MFDTILIAQRGEAAARIARTGKRLGARVIALKASGETEGVHIEASDDAIEVPFLSLGRPDPGAVVEAAQKTCAQAVHPGYASPRHHGALAEAVTAAGLVFVGASAELQSRIRDRLAWRAVADEIGVRVVPASPGPVDDLEVARQAAEALGYPVTCKPVVAGSGWGPVPLSDEDDLEAAVAACRRAGTELLGDGRVVLERWIERPRHLDVTVIATGQGDVLSLGEREASVRRGAHVLIEEGPSPALLNAHDGEAIREALGDVTTRMALGLAMKGAATFELLLDANGRLWLSGVEAGLAVGHPVTDMVAGTDLVELELRVAAGDPLPEALEVLQTSGHALQARVLAEDPAGGFSGEPAVLAALRFPPAPPGKVRAEPSVPIGEELDPRQDPLIAKVAAFAPVRHQALLLLDRVLAETHVAPFETNIRLLRRVLGHESFRAGQYDTDFIARLLST